MANLYVDINANLHLRNKNKQLSVFAHLHWNKKEFGIFNHSTDIYLYSPAFNDPILGNNSAMPFLITFEEDSTVPSIDFMINGFSLCFLAIMISLMRKKKH